MFQGLNAIEHVKKLDQCKVALLLLFPFKLMVTYEAAALLTERFTEFWMLTQLHRWPCVWLWTSHSIYLSPISKMRAGNLATVSH